MTLYSNFFSYISFFPSKIYNSTFKTEIAIIAIFENYNTRVREVCVF